MKKLISWLLLCALLLSLAACGSSGQVVSPTSDSGDWGGRGQPFALKSVELPGQALGLAACGDALCVLVQGEARALYSVEDGQLVQLGYSEADGAAGRMTADDSRCLAHAYRCRWLWPAPGTLSAGRRQRRRLH